MIIVTERGRALLVVALLSSTGCRVFGVYDPPGIPASRRPTATPTTCASTATAARPQQPARAKARGTTAKARGARAKARVGVRVRERAKVRVWRPVATTTPSRSAIE